jgi:hypothetical protein
MTSQSICTKDEMIISINQPAYLPWLGYFDRIAKSDLSIVLDNVQIERNTSTSFTNRNKIKTIQKWTWLTVPIKTSKVNSLNINDIEIDYCQNWQKKHFLSLVHSYSRTPYFANHKDWFDSFYQKSFPLLTPMLRESTDYILKTLNIHTPLVYSSDLQVEGQKSDLILNLCQKVGATVYLSGPFGRDYLDVASFQSAGIELSFHDYQHPTYNQIHGQFEPYMSVVDLLFNCGSDSLQILQSDT